jgi:DNA repair photolyase
LEPNVPPYKHQLEQVRKLIAYGFPADQIVVRIDPIIPTAKGLALVEKIVEEIHIHVPRFRISVLDNYPHVRERFQLRNIPMLYDGQFQASEAEMKQVDATLSRLKFRFPAITFEACAEPQLKQAEQIGCVCKADLQKFGLKARSTSKKQRATCLCVAGKTEMLERTQFQFCAINKDTSHPKDTESPCTKCDNGTTHGCPNACMYCYWK